MRRLVVGLVNDPSAADDVVQQTFLVALESGRTRRGRLGAWLAGVAKNLAFKSCRSAARRKRREVRVADRPRPPTQDPAELVERIEV